MKEIIKSCPGHYATLTEIWERSVRATHKFLTEDDIAEIKAALQPAYFPCVEIYAVRAHEVLEGFIGIADDRIEMLFTDARFRGCGVGSMLIEFAKKRGCRLVDVNEQNPDALSFYRKRGFSVISRDETDESGRPFPILHLELKEQGEYPDPTVSKTARPVVITFQNNGGTSL